jgi:CheY-like chemotaxis protein
MAGADDTILVVEDNADDVLLIERAFGKAKLANPLRFVDNGEKAVDYLSGAGPYADRHSHPMPAVVLLDLKLPRRSGFEVLQWVRAHSSLKALPVVVLTSSKDGDDVRRAYAMGANTYLVKPVALDGLIEIVKTLGLYCFVTAERPVIGE